VDETSRSFYVAAGSRVGSRSWGLTIPQCTRASVGAG